MDVLDIDAWAREIAASEAVRLRTGVREALLTGRGAAGALEEVRRRMARLTPAQREAAVIAIGLTPEPHL